MPAALNAVRAGQFNAEDCGRPSMVKYKGSKLSPLGTLAAKVPEPMLDTVAARQKEILAGNSTRKVDDSRSKGGAKQARRNGRCVSCSRQSGPGSTAERSQQPSP